MEGATPRSSAVSATKVCFRFRGDASPILSEVDLDVEEGRIYGLLGPSGCGKTTLLQCVVGQRRPCSGQMLVYGTAPHLHLQRRNIGYMPQELALYTNMTTEELLTFFGRLFLMEALDIAQRISFLVNLLDIPDRRKQIKYLSGGQQRRTSFAAALVHNPGLLVLDEPTVGVDPILRQKIWTHLRNLAENDKKTIIITTHYIEEAKQAETVGLMREGRLLVQSNPKVLISNLGTSSLEEAFLKICKADSKQEEDLEVAVIPETYTKLNEFSKIQEDYINLSRMKALASPGDPSKAVPQNTPEKVLERRKGSWRGKVKMIVSHLIALVVKDLTHFKRNLPFLIVHTILPAITVTICCFAMGGEPYDLPMAVANMEPPNELGFGDRFLKFVDGQVIIQEKYANLSEAVGAVREGRAWAALYIHQDFSESLTERFMDGSITSNATIDSSTIKLYIDFTNKQIAATLYEKLNNAFKAFSEDMLQNMLMNPNLATPPIMISESVYSSPETSFSNFIAPGTLVMITFICSVGVSAMVLIVDRKQGMLNRSLIAGVNMWEVVLSICCVLMLIQVGQSTLLIVSVSFIVKSSVTLLSVIWVALATFLVGLQGVVFGLLVSTITSDENTASLMILCFYFPTLILSGVVWSIEALPLYVRYISYCLPYTLLCKSLRSIMLRGWGITQHHTWEGFLAGAAWIVFVFLLSSLIMKLKK